MIHQTQARHAEIASVGRDGFEYYDKLGYVPYPEVPELQPKHSNMLMLTGVSPALRNRWVNRISQTSIIRKPRITAICIIRNMVLCGLRMPKAIGVIVLMLRNGAVLSQKEVPGTGLGAYFTIRKVYLN